MSKCFFTEDITGELSCSRDDFDEYGFPLTFCNKFPCEEYKKIQKIHWIGELIYTLKDQIKYIKNNQKMGNKK
jgi:hypothetical protein